MAVLSLPTISTPMLLLALVLAFAFYRIYFEVTTGAARRRIINEHGCLPPYQYPHQGIMGKLYGLDVIKELLKTSREGRVMEESRLRNFSNGRNTTQFRLADRTLTATCHPENVKAILTTNFNDWSLGGRRRRSFIPVFGHGIFAQDGASWERSRAMVRPNFARQQVANLDMFEEHVQHLMDAIPRDGSTVDLQRLFFGLTIDSATEFLFGQSINSLASGLDKVSHHKFSVAFDYLTDWIAYSFRIGVLASWLPDAEWTKSLQIVNDFADHVIRQAIQDLDAGRVSEKQRYVFLYSLLGQTRDPYTVRSELLNILLAGRDTTAGLLSNTWHVLSKRPDIWTKLKAEVDGLGGDKPDYTTIKEMKYLKYILNESLRLMPVVPSNSREAIRDTVLPRGGGPDGQSPVLIAKGMTVMYQTWAMHRLEEYYGPDALEFKPERWEHLRPGWEYLPFNGGPRICVGQQYALIEASYATIRLIQMFPRIESRDERPWSEKLSVTLSSGVGCHVALFDK